MRRKVPAITSTTTPTTVPNAADAAAVSGDGLALHSLGKRFGDVAAVDDVTIDVPAGAFLVLLGPSGCGKTTLLRMIAGLESPERGRIAIAGRTVFDADRRLELAPGKRNVGLVFQSYALWPHMTVAHNVEWPLKVARVERRERRHRRDETLALLGIGDLAGRYPAQLSGGQQQRVAIARTIAARPAVLLLDEPLSNLDAALRQEMRGELARLHREQGTTTVHVTHDQSEAITLATHIAVLDRGRLAQLGTPTELLDAPATPFVAGFVGSPPYVVLDAVTARAGGCHIEDGATVAIRPERISITSDGPLDGVLVESSPLADSWISTVLTGDVRVTVLSSTAPRQPPGQRVGIRLPPHADVTFPSVPHIDEGRSSNSSPSLSAT